MIIGYQVQDQHGNNYGDKPSFLVLSEDSAVSDLMEARKRYKDDCYVMVAILEGDIEEPSFEHPIMDGAEDHYKCLAISIAHLTSSDIRILECRPVNDTELNMIMERDTGFFIKLYEDIEDNVYPAMTTTFNSILVQAAKAGYRLVEFDRDAPIHSNLIDHSSH